MAENIVPLLRPYQEAKHFHQRLRLIRDVRGLTQSQLAGMAELHQSVVAHFESGKRLPSFENLRALAVALRCTSDYLLGIAPSPAEHSGDRITDDIARLSELDREYVGLFVERLATRYKV